MTEDMQLLPDIGRVSLVTDRSTLTDVNNTGRWLNGLERGGPRQLHPFVARATVHCGNTQDFKAAFEVEGFPERLLAQNRSGLPVERLLRALRGGRLRSKLFLS
jgi:hypothetical protein